MRRWSTVVMTCCAALVIAGCGGGSGGGGGGGDVDPTNQTFTNGGASLTAATVVSSGAKTTTVTDANGNTILTAELTLLGLKLTSPGQAASIDTTFSEPLATMPTNYAANILATYIAGQVTSASAQTLGRGLPCLNKDSPGCDWFPDTQCTLGCCADHDFCYDLNGCSAASWLLIGQSSECINCNGIAEVCIARACANVDTTRETDRCYDNRCHEFYDCGVADCYTCTSPCIAAGSPAACTTGNVTNCCGNGTCEVGETPTNCSADCRDGAGTNSCCVANNDCPSELPESCPGACCCCGYGEVCTQDGSHVCTGSAAMTIENAEFVPDWCQGKPKSECK